MASIQEYISHINVPSLMDPNFADGIVEAFQTIEDNFKKIVSAPYLEGQEGNSVDTYDMPIVDSEENLTEFGKLLVRTVFGNDTIEELQDIDSIAPQISSGGKHAYDYILDHPTMKVFRTIDPDTDDVSRWICSAEFYYFLDLRIEDLGIMRNPSSAQNFVDYTCVIFSEYSVSDGWGFTKGDMFPTLYYNTDQQCFCWKVNSVETGIRAQGVKGNDGAPPVSAVVKGLGTVVTDDNTQTKVVSITVSYYNAMQISQSSQEISVYTEWRPIRESGLEDGDLVACIFDVVDESTGCLVPDLVIANIRLVGESDEPAYTIVIQDENRMSSLWKSYLSFYAFRDIDYKSSNPNNSKAIFVPASGDDNVAHAMFQDDSGVQYPSSGGSIDTLGEKNLVFKKVKESGIVGSGSIGTRLTDEYDGETQTKAKFLGYSMEVSGTSKATVSGVPGTLLGVPVGTVVNWLNMESIPDGWFLTGEVDSEANHKQVFALVSTTSNSPDVIVTNQDSELVRLDIYSLDSNGQPLEKDERFKGIFCTLSGYEYANPVSIETTSLTFQDFLSSEYFNWDFFDIDYTDTNCIKFYLTKYNA